MNLLIKYYSRIAAAGSLALISAWPAGAAPQPQNVPYIQQVTPMGDPAIQLSCVGNPGRTYIIEAATSLTPPGSWVCISTNTADANGLFKCIDSDAAKYNYRFYRIGGRLMSGFDYAILAQKSITLSGGARVDGFNSADPNLSLNGQYAADRINAQANIATDEPNTAKAITVSGGAVYGHAYTGPGSTVVASGSASVGDTNWVPTPGIEPGWSASTMSIYIPDAPTAPSATYLPLPSPVSGVYTLSGMGGTNHYTVPSGFNLSGGAKFVITDGTVVLDCVGNFTVSGSSSIVISSNAVLQGFLNGTTTLSGGGIVNETGFAKNCAWYGSVNCTSLTVSGPSGFIGTVDAPEADITYSGSAAFIGSAIGESFTDSGGAAIHYDESLAK